GDDGDAVGHVSWVPCDQAHSAADAAARQAALARQREAVPPRSPTDAAKGATMPDRAPARGTVLQGKRGLIMGVTNERSLGWGIAAACAAQGAELAFTYQVEALSRRVRPLAASIGSDLLLQCDVGDEARIDAAFVALRERWDGLDFLVHAIAFADKQYLRG